MIRHAGAFRLAEALGKHLHEVMAWPGPPTHRQVRAWQTFFNLRDGSEIMPGINDEDRLPDGAERQAYEAQRRRFREERLQREGWTKVQLTPEQRKAQIEEIRRVGGKPPLAVEAQEAAERMAAALGDK